MKVFRESLLFIIFILLLTSCESGEKVEPLTKEELLMQKGWRITGFSIDNNTEVEDIYAGYDACQKDNFMKFMAGGKVMLDEGPSNCNPEDVQTINGTWHLNTNLLTLAFENAIPYTYTIQELTHEKLVLRIKAYGETTTISYIAQ